VLYPLFHGPHLFDQVGEIAAVLDEVDVRAVDHEERCLSVIVKVASKRLRQLLQILRRDTTLVVALALLEATHEDVRAGLEIDDEVGTRQPLVQHLEDLLVELELVGAEGERREDPVLGEQVVRDRPLREQVELTQLALLPIALEQEEELVWKACLSGSS
jgi:hypothetical protein